MSQDKTDLPEKPQGSYIRNTDNLSTSGISENTLSNNGKKHKNKLVKNVILILLLLLAVYLFYSLGSVFFAPDRNVQQIYLVPEDAVFVVQSSEPVKDWKRFSSSEPWQCLKRAGTFAEVAQGVEILDSIIHNNKTLLSLVGKRDLTISIHKTRTTEWDFLVLVDMQKISKINLLKEQVENILKLGGNTVTRRKYNGIDIIEMRDSETRDILYTAFIDNHFAVSYNSRLIEAAADERVNPIIGREHSFIETEKLIGGKGLYRVFINYHYLPQFLSIYLGQQNEYINLFSKSMDFAGLYMHSDKEKFEVKGHTILNEQADPYVQALLNSGKHKMKAHEIMSDRTAFYANLGFENPSTFLKQLEDAMSANDKSIYDDYRSSRKKIESFFGISLDENFLSWMSGEFALSQSEPGLLGQEAEMILAIRAKSIKDARKNMEFIEKRVKGRSPVKVKNISYKSYDINYVEMKGFFRLFFGSLFDKFEKPYYTYIEDYVVFSNKPSSLLSFIEDYDQKRLLSKNSDFKKVINRSNTSSTIFTYIDMPKFYYLLQPMLNAETWKSIRENRDVMLSFPQWSFQVVGEKNIPSMQFVLDYIPYVPEQTLFSENMDINSVDKEDKEMNEDAETEKELMNELKRFYVEKFQGNVLREYYEDGAIKSESEVKNGKRHGRYREYFENGNLRLRGKYVNNLPKGTWKYYTEEGKFDHKEKY